MGDAEQIGAGEDPCGMEGHELAIGVTGGHVGGQPQRLEHGQHPGLDRPKGRLGDVGAGERGGGGLDLRLVIRARRQDEPRQRAADGLGQHGIRLGQTIGKGREEGRHIGVHLGVGGALAGEDQRELARVQQRRVREGGPGRAGFGGVGQMGGQRGQPRGQILGLAHHDGGGQPLGRGLGIKRIGQIGEGRLPALRQPVEDRLHLFGQRRAVRRPPDQEFLRPAVAGHGGQCGDRGLARILLECHVEVGAAEAEGRDAGPPRHVVAAPPTGRGRSTTIERQVGVHQAGVRRMLAPVRRQHARGGGLSAAFTMPRDARRGLGVADLGLDRPDGRVRGRAPASCQEPRHRLHLGGVADHGAGAMRLEHAHRGGGIARHLVGPLAARGSGRRDAGRSSTWPCRRTSRRCP
jgi:hypothetical protein